jgi:hypothetical protein
MEKWEQYKALHDDENISCDDALVISNYCISNQLPAPTLRVVMPSTAFEDGMTIDDFVKLNGFPSDEPVHVMGKWGSKVPVEMKQVRIAADNNDVNEYPGWEDYFLMLNVSNAQQRSKEEAVMYVFQNDPAKEQEFFGDFEKL